MRYTQLQQRLKNIADPQKAKVLQGFFKTGKGEYAEGDIFIGVVVPQSRNIAKEFIDLPLPEVKKLMTSPIHEERLTALFILTEQFKKDNEKIKKEIFDFYLSHTKYINNWDLVDLSAPNIVGEYLIKNRKMDDDILTKLAHSSSLWNRRIAIIATFTFIKNKRYEDTFTISEILLTDSHDLIQKAVGWMLREVGKRISQEKEEEFLRSHYKKMPRTMLRYAVERFPENRRREYLEGII